MDGKKAIQKKNTKKLEREALRKKLIADLLAVSKEDWEDCLNSLSNRELDNLFLKVQVSRGDVEIQEETEEQPRGGFELSLSNSIKEKNFERCTSFVKLWILLPNFHFIVAGLDLPSESAINSATTAEQLRTLGLQIVRADFEAAMLRTDSIVALSLIVARAHALSHAGLLGQSFDSFCLSVHVPKNLSYFLIKVPAFVTKFPAFLHLHSDYFRRFASAISELKSIFEAIPDLASLFMNEAIPSTLPQHLDWARRVFDQISPGMQDVKPEDFDSLLSHVTVASTGSIIPRKRPSPTSSLSSSILDEAFNRHKRNAMDMLNGVITVNLPPIPVAGGPSSSRSELTELGRHFSQLAGLSHSPRTNEEPHERDNMETEKRD